MITTLTLELRVGESVQIDSGKVVVTLAEKSGQRARLQFRADEDVSIKKTAPAGAEQAKRGINV